MEEHTLATLPSASTMKYLDRKPPPDAASPLAVGNPELGPGLRLPYAQDEIETVRARYPKATILTGSEATEAAVKAQSVRADILHFATHTELDELAPQTSSILLTPDRGEDGRLEVREIPQARAPGAACCAVRLRHRPWPPLDSGRRRNLRTHGSVLRRTSETRAGARLASGSTIDHGAIRPVGRRHERPSSADRMSY